MTRKHPGAAEFAEWVTDHAAVLGFDIAPKANGYETTPTMNEWRTLAVAIERARQPAHTPRRDPLARHLRRLGEAVGLTVLDVVILQALLLYETEPVVEDLLDRVFTGDRHRRLQALSLRNDCVPCVLGESAATIRSRLAPDAPLIRTGLASVDEDQDVSIPSRLRRLAGVPPKGVDVLQLLLGDTRQSELEWSDFDHLGTVRDDVANLLTGALRQHAQGVNVLVYGPPGTGKTEFCHVLARHVGTDLFSVGETDEFGGEPSRRERLQELCLAQSLLGEGRHALLLFDEMDDVLNDHGGMSAYFTGLLGCRMRGGVSKIFMNRLLEDAPSPTLWTTNDVRGINPAVVRRMLFAVEMRQPPARIRARIWSRQLARHGIEASAEDALALAHEFDATPGVAAGATVAAELCDGGFEVVRRGVRTLSRALGCDKPSRPAIASFDPAFTAADIDLAALAGRLADAGATPFSLCLQGPPGTGKSAYACHLADRLGMQTLHKRCSDLLSMYVGGTEANIARAFAEARDDGSFLIFDEADSLLADRRGAHRNWEISQVNEMLTWMENHPLPFACTTNYAERLDVATLRRFIFKVELQFMTPAMVQRAFRSWFDMEAPPEVCNLSNLTPGDFVVVRRKATLLAEDHDPESLANLLKTECDAKPGRSSALGFAA